eukprot:Gb_00214 [translate_table: standard]
MLVPQFFIFSIVFDYFSPPTAYRAICQGLANKTRQIRGKRKASEWHQLMIVSFHIGWPCLANLTHDARVVICNEMDVLILSFVWLGLGGRGWLQSRDCLTQNVISMTEVGPMAEISSRAQDRGELTVLGTVLLQGKTSGRQVSSFVTLPLIKGYCWMFAVLLFTSKFQFDANHFLGITHADAQGQTKIQNFLDSLHHMKAAPKGQNV